MTSGQGGRREPELFLNLWRSTEHPNPPQKAGGEHTNGESSGLWSLLAGDLAQWPYLWPLGANVGDGQCHESEYALGEMGRQLLAGGRVLEP